MVMFTTYSNEITDGDEDVIFEEDEKEDEGYLFAGHGMRGYIKVSYYSILYTIPNTTTLMLYPTEEDDEVIEEVDMGDDDRNVPEVFDSYDKVYDNVSSEMHMPELVENCKHCDAKMFELEPPGFCCHSGNIHLSNPDIPPDLMRLWTKFGLRC